MPTEGPLDLSGPLRCWCGPVDIDCSTRCLMEGVLQHFAVLPHVLCICAGCQSVHVVPPFTDFGVPAQQEEECSRGTGE